ncbi:MAG: flavodoxin family protein [Chloroflexi bacterium]|nr:flavodoxin family protein [Chloroflexota bacterium]
MKVLGLAGSPRRGGNTDILLARALEGARSVGAETESVVLANLDIEPCRHCEGCVDTGVCVVDDDMQPMHRKLLQADRLILASPIFFMSVTAQAKIFIDRCQALWALKYLLKERHPTASDGSRRRGLFISVGGQKWPYLFDAAVPVVKAFFSVCDVEYGEELFFRDIDPVGAVKSHPTALQDAFEAGRRLVGQSSPPHLLE